MSTALLYMKEMQWLDCEATVISVSEENKKIVVLLDRTIFYPQGGGQPYDQGRISSAQAKFNVAEVRFIDGVVKHIGQFEKGEFNEGDSVTCEVDAERRALMSRLHSAGHVLDRSVHEQGLDWVPGKGYHFPDGPYVEYTGTLNSDDTETLKSKIEKTANKLIDQHIETRIEFMPKEKPARVVFYGNYGVPCGGTHVANLSDIGKMYIQKIKLAKGNIRVSYTIE